MSRSAALAGEKSFSTQEAFVRDHQISGPTIVPLAAWIVWVHELLSAGSATGTSELTDLFVRNPLVIDGPASQSVRFETDEDAADQEHFQIIPTDEAEPTLLLDGRWRRLTDAVEPLPIPATDSLLNSTEFYELARRNGLAYGSCYHRLDRIGIGAEGWRAEITSVDTQTDPFLHRLTVLDALLQGGAVLPIKEQMGGWIPYRIDQIQLAEFTDEKTSTGGIVVGQWLSHDAQERIAHMDWIDPQSGTVRAAFRGVRYRKVRSLGKTAPVAASTTTTATRTVDAGHAQSLLERLRAADAAQRPLILTTSIEEYVLHLLRWKESRRKDLARGFVAIGLDSLLSVDLQFRLQTELKFSLPPGTGLNQPTIADLSVFLLSHHPEFRA